MVPSRRARVGVEEVGAITAINPNAASPTVDDTTREAGVPDAYRCDAPGARKQMIPR